MMSAQISELRPAQSYDKTLAQSEIFHVSRIIKSILKDDAEACVIAEHIACNITQERLVAVIRGLMRGDRENVFALMLEAFNEAVIYVASGRAEVSINDEQDAVERRHAEMMANRLI